jgi:hypothetical protein
MNELLARKVPRVFRRGGGGASGDRLHLAGTGAVVLERVSEATGLSTALGPGRQGGRATWECRFGRPSFVLFSEALRRRDPAESRCGEV